MSMSNASETAFLSLLFNNTDWANVGGAADLRGILSMAGGWTPFTDLSPEGLAQAVLAALLAGPATPANVVQINSAGVTGTGQSGDMWRGE